MEIVVQTYKPFNVKVKVHTAKAGEVFGWSALVKPYVYTASAECVEKVEEVYIKGSELMNLFEQNDHTGYVIMRNLSGHVSSRLTESREKLIKEIANSYNLEW